MSHLRITDDQGATSITDLVRPSCTPVVCCEEITENSYERPSQSLETFKWVAGVPETAQIVTMMRSTSPLASAARHSVSGASAIGRVTARRRSPGVLPVYAGGESGEPMCETIGIQFPKGCSDAVDVDGFTQTWNGHDHPHRARHAR